MILYHGTNLIVDKPILIKRDRFLDFGNGFYTTTNKEQAITFVRKVALRRGGKPIVNAYEINENCFEKLNGRFFAKPDAEWLDFASAHRSGTYNNEIYDLIAGPVANDDVFRTIQLYMTDVLNKEQALEILKIKSLYDQYVFCTEKALPKLTFLQAEEY